MNIQREIMTDKSGCMKPDRITTLMGEGSAVQGVYFGFHEVLNSMFHKL